ncbi:MAG: alanine racemase [Chitinophagales bacterium]
MESASHIELSASALENNITFIRSMLGDTKFSAVVKGNAYGHGIATFCPMLYANGVRHYSVFSAQEAYMVIQDLPKDITVLIMGMIAEEQLPWAIEHDIEFFVFDDMRLNAAIAQAQKVKKPARIHLELETGMNRTGFALASLQQVFRKIADNKRYVQVIGICSHLAGAESVANYKRIKVQYDRFQRVRKMIGKMEGFSPMFHLACSAASIQYPKTRMHLARIGILQYGFFPSAEVKVQYFTQHKTHINPLQRVITWKTYVMDISTVKEGEFIGYGTSFFTNNPTRIAVIPVGYAQGFARSLSNTGKVLIRGQRFAVIGVVNMNMMIVDITESDDIERGDEVVLIGRQGDLEISVASFGDYSDMVNYELLTRLPADIPRKVVE